MSTVLNEYMMMICCAVLLGEDSVSDEVSEIARHIARLPKANGRRGRIVVFTGEHQPTVVVQDGVVTR